MMAHAKESCYAPGGRYEQVGERVGHVDGHIGAAAVSVYVDEWVGQ